MDATSRRIKIDPWGQERFALPMVATGVGEAKVILRALGEVFSDAIEVPVPVLPPAGQEEVGQSGEISAPGSVALGDLSSIRGDVGGLDVVASGSALVGLYRGLEQLIEYPYGCTEQLTSRLVPLVVLRDLASQTGAPLPPDVDAAAREAVDKLAGHQQPDGVFGLWPGSPGDAWLTAYALWGLQEAQARGVAVRPGVIEQGRAWLRSSFEHRPQAARDDDLPFIHEVLAASQPVDRGAWLGLFKDREKRSLASQAALLHGLWRAGLRGEAAVRRASGPRGGHVRAPARGISGGEPGGGAGVNYRVLIDAALREAPSATCARGMGLGGQVNSR